MQYLIAIWGSIALLHLSFLLFTQLHSSKFLFTNFYHRIFKKFKKGDIISQEDFFFFPMPTRTTIKYYEILATSRHGYIMARTHLTAENEYVKSPSPLDVLELNFQYIHETCVKRGRSRDSILLDFKSNLLKLLK